MHELCDICILIINLFYLNLDGYFFRVNIVIPKELTIIKKRKTSKGVVIYKNNEESITLEKFETSMPKLTAAIHR